jgi:hypothetical protein
MNWIQLDQETIQFGGGGVIKMEMNLRVPTQQQLYVLNLKCHV